MLPAQTLARFFSSLCQRLNFISLLSDSPVFPLVSVPLPQREAFLQRLSSQRSLHCLLPVAGGIGLKNEVVSSGENIFASEMFFNTGEDLYHAVCKKKIQRGGVPSGRHDRESHSVGSYPGRTAENSSDLKDSLHPWDPCCLHTKRRR
jgi:hypothetical protein